MAARDERDRFPVSLVLFDEDARTERGGRVVVDDGDDALRDDGPAVQRLVNEVNGAAGKFDPVRDGLTLRVESGKGRQQARMNVENAVAESLYEAGREQTHVTREADQINRTFCE